jgi:thiol:disulfide interchange protein DsbD
MKRPAFPINSFTSIWLQIALIGIFTTLSLTALAFGESFDSEDDVNASPLSAIGRLHPSAIEPGATAEIVIEMELADRYHAYLDKFKLTVTEPSDFKLDEFKITPVVQFMDTFSKKMKDGVEKKATMRALVEIPESATLGKRKGILALTYQACTKEHCLFPKTISLDMPYEVIAAKTAEGNQIATNGLTPGAISSPLVGDQFHNALEQGTLFALLVVFGMGFLTSLTPCIYPMIPITLAILGTRTQGQSRLKSFSLSFVYVLGIAITYAILGVIAASTGSLFGSALSNIWVVTGIAAIFILMAVSMYGFFELQAPAFIRNRFGGSPTSSSFSGAFLTGLVAGVVASPCVGPVLVSVLAYIAQTQNLILGFTFLFTFALGMGVLFMILGTSSSLITKVPKAGPWMNATKFIFGSIMVAMAFYFVKPHYPSWLLLVLVGLSAVLISSAHGAFESGINVDLTGRLRKGLMLTLLTLGLTLVGVGTGEKAGFKVLTLIGFEQTSSSATAKLPWAKYSKANLEQALATGKPVILDFWAEWCGACIELEEKTFIDPRIQSLSREFVLLKFDATEGSPELDELKAVYGVMGLPTMIFYDTKGVRRSDLTVLGFEDADTFLGRMKAALSPAI